MTSPSSAGSGDPRDFVANVSHELRTPLTAIKGYAETLLGPAGDDRETARRFLGVIDRHSERLGRLIDDLLALSDLELGRTALRLGTVTVAAVVEDVLQILGEAAMRKGVRVRAEIAPHLPRRMRTAMAAAGAHQPGRQRHQKLPPSGGRVCARAPGARRARRHGRDAVEDSGVGVPVQDLPLTPSVSTGGRASSAGRASVSRS
jgi:two-component system phosphate regulon sensor histidine kinase PhoR